MLLVEEVLAFARGLRVRLSLSAAQPAALAPAVAGSSFSPFGKSLV